MAGLDAFGTQWQTETAPSTFTTVADVTNITVLDIEVDTIDVSAHDSTGQWREFVAGMKDGGELSMDINYDPTAHDTIFDLIGTEESMKIILPDAGAAEVAFSAIVTGFSAEAPYDDKLAASVTLKVTGAVSVTP